MEKGWRKRFDKVKDTIMDGYRRGICDTDGHTVKTASGRPVAKPRTMGSMAKSLCMQCRKWYFIKEGHSCYVVGSCYQYIYGGPGPDYVTVVLVGVDNSVGRFVNLDGDYPEKELTLPLDSDSLTLCGPENWRRAMSSQSEEIKKIMKHAYKRTFAA